MKKYIEIFFTKLLPSSNLINTSIFSIDFCIKFKNFLYNKARYEMISRGEIKDVCFVAKNKSFAYCARM